MWAARRLANTRMGDRSYYHNPTLLTHNLNFNPKTTNHNPNSSISRHLTPCALSPKWLSTVAVIASCWMHTVDDWTNYQWHTKSRYLFYTFFSVQLTLQTFQEQKQDGVCKVQCYSNHHSWIFNHFTNFSFLFFFHQNTIQCEMPL